MVSTLLGLHINSFLSSLARLSTSRIHPFPTNTAALSKMHLSVAITSLLLLVFGPNVANAKANVLYFYSGRGCSGKASMYDLSKARSAFCYSTNIDAVSYEWGGTPGRDRKSPTASTTRPVQIIDDRIYSVILYERSPGAPKILYCPSRIGNFWEKALIGDCYNVPSGYAGGNYALEAPLTYGCDYAYCQCLRNCSKNNAQCNDQCYRGHCSKAITPGQGTECTGGSFSNKQSSEV